MGTPSNLPPVDVARHILWEREAHPTSNLHLQKLAYFCHGWALASYGKPLIGESACAWPLGPVFPTIYNQYRTFGSIPIRDKGDDYSQMLGPDLLELIKMVLGDLFGFSPRRLSDITHEPGSPWAITREESGLWAPIPNEYILHYFRLVEPS